MVRVLVIIAEWYNLETVMRSFFAHKYWVILLSLLALGALTALAMGMRGLSFRERQVFERNEEEFFRVNPADLIRAVVAVPLKTQFVFWGLAVLLFVLIAVLLSPEARKRLLLALFRAAVTYWVLYLLFTRYPQVLSRISEAFALSGIPRVAHTDTVPPPVFVPPPTSSWMTYFIGFGIALLLAFLAWRILRIWRKPNPSVSDLPVRRLAGVARASLGDLTSGRDSTDVILNCYFRMSDVVAEKKNLDRRASMTPQEFAARLEQAGLPSEAVKRLTRLFESVRYGQRQSDLKMVNEAIACLATILQYCGERV